MTEPLPSFRYHPDPIATGSVEASSATCHCCQRKRGHIYTGPVYADVELGGAVCPWCIASGEATVRFDASFTDVNGIGNYGEWAGVSKATIAEVSERTPGFSGWQQERWWTHCGDAAQYLGRAGHADLAGRWAAAVPAIRSDIGFTGPDWEQYLSALTPDGSPSAYVFQCLHCGQLGGYSDFH